jgi:hypothetical protein
VCGLQYDSLNCVLVWYVVPKAEWCNGVWCAVREAELCNCVRYLCELGDRQRVCQLVTGK